MFSPTVIHFDYLSVYFPVLSGCRGASPKRPASTVLLFDLYRFWNDIRPLMPNSLPQVMKQLIKVANECPLNLSGSSKEGTVRQFMAV